MKGIKDMKKFYIFVTIIAIVSVFCNMAMETEIRNLKAENYELRKEIEEYKNI